MKKGGYTFDPEQGSEPGELGSWRKPQSSSETARRSFSQIPHSLLHTLSQHPRTSKKEGALLLLRCECRARAYTGGRRARLKGTQQSLASGTRTSCLPFLAKEKKVKCGIVMETILDWNVLLQRRVSGSVFTVSFVESHHEYLFTLHQSFLLQISLALWSSQVFGVPIKDLFDELLLKRTPFSCGGHQQDFELPQGRPEFTQLG